MAGGQRGDLHAAEDELLGVGHREDFRQPSIQQRFGISARSLNLAPLSLFDAFRLASERKQGERGVYEQLFERPPVGEKTDVGRMLDDFKGHAHTEILPPSPESGSLKWWDEPGPANRFSMTGHPRQQILEAWPSERPPGLQDMSKKMLPPARSDPGTRRGRCWHGLALAIIVHSAGASLLRGQATAPPPAAFPLAKGEVISSVFCLRSPQQSYALFLPSAYTPARAWPIVYAFDPGARGSAPVQMLKDLAEKYGYIVAGSNNSRNGPLKDQAEAAQAMWRDTHERFSVDDKRQYATGFSGGARAAALFALLCNGCAAGVIAHGAGLPPTESSPEKVYFAYFLAIGDLDFNYPEVVQLQHQLDKLGIANRLRRFPGPHRWAPPEIWTEAIEWMELRAMREGRRAKDEAFLAEQSARASQRVRELEEAGNLYTAYEEYRNLTEEFQGLADTALFARKAAELKEGAAVREAVKREKEEINEQQRLTADLLAHLEALKAQTVSPAMTMRLHSKLSELKDAVKSAKEPSKARAAKRAQSEVFARFYENGVLSLTDKQFSLAASLLESASEAAPESPAPFYQLARVYAESGNKKKALEALHQAVKRGLRNAKLLQETLEFAALKDNEEFKKILAGLAAP